MSCRPSTVTRPVSPTGRVLFAVLFSLFAAAAALAHDGRPHSLRELVVNWTWDPLILISLALSIWLYFRGVGELWRESAVGRGILHWQTCSYGLGWLALVLALVSPLHALGEVLFSAHMVQHEVLMLVAAPLLVLGRPLIAYLWALPPEWRRRVGGWSKAGWWQRLWRAGSGTFAAWAIHGVALWVWHLPALFQATLASDFVHTLQHVSFLGSALLFWWALIHGRQGVMGYGAAVLYVFSTAMHSGLLGALLTVTTRLWYPSYRGLTVAWGLTPLEDQQLGGLVMWVPGGIVYAGAGLLLFAAWLRGSEKRARITAQVLPAMRGDDERRPTAAK